MGEALKGVWHGASPLWRVDMRKCDMVTGQIVLKKVVNRLWCSKWHILSRGARIVIVVFYV